MKKEIRLKRLTIIISECKYVGDTITVIDNNTKSAVVISGDIGMGLMIDPVSSDQWKKCLSSAIISASKLIN